MSATRDGDDGTPPSVVRGFALRIQPDEHPDGPRPKVVAEIAVDPTEPSSLAEIVAATRFSKPYLPDGRADWHHNLTAFGAWIRAHTYRLTKHWRERQLADWLKSNPQKARAFGFTEGDGGLSAFAGDPPSQSRLWEVWNEEFGDGMRDLCRRAAEAAMEVAREIGVPAPDEVFEPEDREVESERSERRLTEQKIREVWSQTKPLVTDTFSLNRAENSRVPEASVWEAQTFAGTQQDTFTEGGLETFRMNTTRPPEQQHTGRTHRHHLQDLGVDETRQMLRETTRTLIARARANNELQGHIWAAIDITKGAPWTGDVDRDDGGKLEEEFILGYKDNEIYFQWATIQIVGLDVPLVLDAKPVERGMKRADIVDDLLEGALDIVPDLDLLMMDREFDAAEVRATCEKHDVYYLTPGKKHASEKATCSRLRERGQKVHVEEKSTLTGPSRKVVYLPAKNTDVFEQTEGDSDDLDGALASGSGSSEDDQEDDRDAFRQELMADFTETTGADVDTDDDMWFDDVVDEVRETEPKPAGSDEDASAYALFKSNHPALDADEDADREALLSTARGFVARYSNRWGIENGYKQLKQFRVRTTSKDHGYRYFCFAFAAVLYNVWRLVDLLVKLALEDDPAYSPRVKAGTFLTLAGNNDVGLDPPG